MMRVCVHGLWHLGSVTTACLASGGHMVIGLDENSSVVNALEQGEPPVYEPGLPDLIREGTAAGRLRFTTNRTAALADIDVYWVTYDTPVDEGDVADVDFVLSRVSESLPALPRGCLTLISSQLPAGSTRNLARHAQALGLGETLSFAYSPENLRLGNAISVFTSPDRVVVGIDGPKEEARIRELFAPFTESLLFMSIESAEMAKHAINAFFAMSVAFANEIGTLCEQVGADAADIARALKSEARIGPKAYVTAGMPFGGGTLARDIAFLCQLGDRSRLKLSLLPAVRLSNDEHRTWALRTLKDLIGEVAGKTVAILGLTYKPGTSTLRRSAAVELARALITAGAVVRAFDPQISPRSLETDLPIFFGESIEDALSGADVAVVATDWPQFRTENWDRLIRVMSKPVIVDPGGLLADQLAFDEAVTYAAVGRGARRRTATQVLL
jgi:UDPglucose 6-dehydrogenase